MFWYICVVGGIITGPPFKLPFNLVLFRCSVGGQSFSLTSLGGVCCDEVIDIAVMFVFCTALNLELLVSHTV